MEWLAELEIPVICASMVGAADGRLAAAVTAAGGLGTIGVGTATTAEALTADCAVAREAGPFGLGLMSWALDADDAILDTAVAENPVVISLSFGDPAPYVQRARAGGASVVSQVGTLAEAHRALDAGVDALIARGSEGGGHGRGEVATLPLLQQVLEISPVPVIAAGGIGTARGLAAVLAAGAVGAWVGTPFAACAESAFGERLKAAVIAADASETVYTRVFDIAQRLAWPPEYGGRAIANDFSRRWADRVDDLEAALAAQPSITDDLVQARGDQRVEVAPVYAGESVGLVSGARSAAEVVAGFGGFRAHLDAAGRWLR